MFFILFFTSFFTTINSWLPFSHQTFTCNITSGNNIHKCFYENDTYTNFATLGGSSPDAFKQSAKQLHSLHYAVFQYFFSLKYKSDDDLFDPIAIRGFSIGYNFHLIEDMIGHHHNGYISSQYDDVQCLAIDGYQYFTFFKDKSNIFPFRKLTKEVLEFVYNAQVEYSKVYPEKLPTAMTKLKVEEDGYAFNALQAVEGLVIKELDKNYKDQMIDMANCVVKNWDQTFEEYLLSIKWMELSTAHWLEVVKKTTEVEVVVQEVENLVEDLFKKHNGTICINYN